MLVGVDFVLGAADRSEATLLSRIAWCYHYMLCLWSADCKNRCIVLRGSELDKWVFVIIVYLQIRPVADEKRTICQLQLRDIVPMFSLGVLSSDMMSAGGNSSRIRSTKWLG